MIDGNEVCSASEILFKDLRGTKYEVEAVSYFITSPIIASDKKLHWTFRVATCSNLTVAHVEEESKRSDASGY